ncbi:MAG: type II toxin-antitoxin system HicB family antitoxin [Candidatus Dormibacteria bacterium]
MTTDYHIDVFYSTEDECWIADVPDLQFCSAHGPTPETAVQEVMVALEGWLEVAREHGDPIPEPRFRRAAATG